MFVTSFLIVRWKYNFFVKQQKVKWPPYRPPFMCLEDVENSKLLITINWGFRLPMYLDDFHIE